VIFNLNIHIRKITHIITHTITHIIICLVLFFSCEPEHKHVSKQKSSKSSLNDYADQITLYDLLVAAFEYHRKSSTDISISLPQNNVPSSLDDVIDVIKNNSENDSKINTIVLSYAYYNGLLYIKAKELWAVIHT
jgi:hypothetical protein